MFCNKNVLCVSLAASGDIDGLEIWSLAGADLTKPGYDGKTTIQVVGLRNTCSIINNLQTTKSSISLFYSSQAEAAGRKEVVAFLVQLTGNKSMVTTGSHFHSASHSCGV